MATVKLDPIHPGEVLREEFMVPLNLSINRVARDLRLPLARISEIVNRKRGVTASTALRLARYFNTSAQFWLNLQTAYELELSEQAEARAVRREVRPLPQLIRAS